MSKATALYFDCLSWQEDNIELLTKYFDLTRQPFPNGGRTKVEIVFWPLGYHFLKARYPDTRYLVMNTSFKPTLDSDQITIISNWNNPDMKRITATAEHTLGLILAIHRGIPAYHTEASWGMWNRTTRPAEKMLSEMHLCIWGAGRIGKMLHKIATPIFEKVTLADTDTEAKILLYCDILAVTASIREEDIQPILDKDKLKLLRPTAFVVNTARGDLIDTEYLLTMLDLGELAGVALDVLPNEFEPGFTPMYSSVCEYARREDNLILTPHIGGSTISAWRATERAVILDVMNRVYEK
jgi:phosphoglycerate dehydrogenase-like enzyme